MNSTHKILAMVPAMALGIGLTIPALRRTLGVRPRNITG